MVFCCGPTFTSHSLQMMQCCFSQENLSMVCLQNQTLTSRFSPVLHQSFHHFLSVLSSSAASAHGSIPTLSNMLTHRWKSWHAVVTSLVQRVAAAVDHRRREAAAGSVSPSRGCSSAAGRWGNSQRHLKTKHRCRDFFEKWLFIKGLDEHQVLVDLRWWALLPGKRSQD